MPVAIAPYNILEAAALEALGATEPERLRYRPEGGAYLNLVGLPLEPLPSIDEDTNRQALPRSARPGVRRR